MNEADIRAYVQSQPFFQTEGKFDKDKLKTVLASQGMSSPQFTAQVRNKWSMSNLCAASRRLPW